MPLRTLYVRSARGPVVHLADQESLMDAGMMKRKSLCGRKAPRNGWKELNASMTTTRPICEPCLEESGKRMGL